jgi:RNA polymerase sigma-70 factor (ECF subfamily)
MDGVDSAVSTTPAEARVFPNTRWSVVLSAKDRTAPESAAALETLCRVYWRPLYVFARGAGHSPEDAQDLTQEFFARLLAKDYLQRVDREKGRFRTFLRVAFKRFLADDWDRRRAQKRGSGHRALSIETPECERLFERDFIEAATPDFLYERRWALTLLEEAHARLALEYRSNGKSNELEWLKPHLTAERGDIPYREISSRLGISEGSARVAIHRLRKRFREIFRETIADTVSNPTEIDAEIKFVIEALSHV